MKRLSSVLFCFVLALVACGQDKGKATTGKKATTLSQSKEPTQKKSTKAQKKAPTQTQKNASTQAQKKQQDRMGDCNKQANLKNMKGEERKTFVSKCLRA